jgi:hypothetical protein
MIIVLEAGLCDRIFSTESIARGSNRIDSDLFSETQENASEPKQCMILRF